MKISLRFAVLCGTLIGWSSNCSAQQSEPAKASSATQARTMARLFWQDTSNASIRWGNLQKGTDWQLQAAAVEGFPKLDTDACGLVQMKQIDGLLLTGVRDEEDGKVSSGWIAVDSGVDQEAHGDHFHWKFQRNPVTKAKKLGTDQGNPAHLYVYNKRFYLANDAKNGFTAIDPVALRAGQPTEKFFSGGGGHITLAAIDNQVCYSTWIDREGDNLGRVDVVPLASSAATGYRFQLPTGGIHGATSNSGKVFFAPSEGVCWVQADKLLTARNVSAAVNHISLGQSKDDKPMRTGAFTNHLNWVLFTTGSGSEGCLCMLNAQSPKPSLIKFPVGLAEGTTMTTPVAIQTKSNEHYACLFQESKDHDQPEKLIVVKLDANADGQLGDLAVAKSISVGASHIDGHSGHHELTTSSSGRLAFITNPGDGDIWVVSLTDFLIQAKLKVGGTPTHIEAIGG